jgi:lipopolysaccharide/colanic/teichoic acid biosynthesis glycosyltransferase
VEDALVKLQYDLYYIKHQSLYLDLLILLKTVSVVLSFQGT